ncbi:MAG: replicative DNA helicase [Clostridia bacterium]|nr:replicative DNA helicase [Clostridia bacterium]
MADNDLLALNGIQMPWSAEAEQAVLGCILIDNECINSVLVHVTSPDYFYQPRHQSIYRAMMTLQNENRVIDALVVLDMLVADGEFDNVSGREYLFNLTQSVVSTENVESYARIVREKYYIRTLISISADTIEKASAQETTADRLLDDAEQKIYDIRQGKVNDSPEKLYNIIVPPLFDTISKLTGEDKDLYKGYTTGFNELDNILTGLNRSDLIIIGARPAMGKTSFALNLARNVSLIGKRKVLFFSLEMTKEQLAARVLGTEARVSSTKMRSGNISKDEMNDLVKATTVLKNCELYFDDTSAITVPEMKAKTRRLGGVECVIIDYLGLIKGATKAENRVNEVSEITRNLKNMAKDLNIPVICCAQLSRGTEGRGKSHKPMLSDLRESGSIEQDADIVMMLYREDYYKEDSSDDSSEYSDESADVNKVSVIISKNRHGSVGTVDFAWDSEHTLFIPFEKVHND